MNLETWETAEQFFLTTPEDVSREEAYNLLSALGSYDEEEDE